MRSRSSSVSVDASVEAAAAEVDGSLVKRVGSWNDDSGGADEKKRGRWISPRDDDDELDAAAFPSKRLAVVAAAMADRLPPARRERDVTRAAAEYIRL